MNNIKRSAHKNFHNTVVQKYKNLIENVIKQDKFAIVQAKKELGNFFFAGSNHQNEVYWEEALDGIF
jgi:hypothetical protein